MKKLLLILLCLPMIGFGKPNSSHNKLQNTDAKDTWKIINNAPFLTSEFRSNCDEPINVESRIVSFRKKNIFLGVGGETGGTIMMIMFNTSKNLYKVIFAHDNDGYGDGSIHEFIFKYQLNKIVFPNEWWDTDFNDNSISNLTYHNCYL